MTRALLATSDGLVELGGGVELQGQVISAIALHSDETWLITAEDAVWRRDGSWREVARTSEFSIRCILPTDDGVLVGTSGARLFRVVSGGFDPDETFDEAPGRGKWYTPWGGPPDVRSLTAGDDGTVFAGVHVGGILRTAGTGWEQTIDIDADVHQVLAPAEAPGLVLAATARGLATSEDGGSTWRIDAEGLHGSYCRAVALGGDVVLVSASTGPFTKQAAIYRRPIGSGGSFERATNGLPEWFETNVDTACLAARGDTAVAAVEGSVFRSEDGGATWEPAADDLAPVHGVALTSG